MAIIGATHEDYVRATMTVGRCRVLECSQIADAACPVYLRAGDHLESAGQAADYRHTITGQHAAQHGAGAIVTSYWDGQRLSVAIEGVGRTIDRGAVDAEVRRILDHREKQPQRDWEAGEEVRLKQAQQRYQDQKRADDRAANLAFQHLGISPLPCWISWWGNECYVRLKGGREVRVGPDGTCETTRS